jgi:hypothetical protein
MLFIGLYLKEMQLLLAFLQVFKSALSGLTRCQTPNAKRQTRNAKMKFLVASTKLLTKVKILLEVVTLGSLFLLSDSRL